MNAILTDFTRKQIKTLDDIVAYDHSFKRLKQATKQESFPLWTLPDYNSDDQSVDAATNERLKASLERIKNKK